MIQRAPKSTSLFLHPSCVVQYLQNIWSLEAVLLLLHSWAFCCCRYSITLHTCIACPAHAVATTLLGVAVEPIRSARHLPTYRHRNTPGLGLREFSAAVDCGRADTAWCSRRWPGCRACWASIRRRGGDSFLAGANDTCARLKPAYTVGAAARRLVGNESIPTYTPENAMLRRRKLCWRNTAHGFKRRPERSTTGLLRP